jgi:hypothetical protein
MQVALIVLQLVMLCTINDEASATVGKHIAPRCAREGLQFAGLPLTELGNSRTGHAGELPQKPCCNASDFHIKWHLLNETVDDHRRSALGCRVEPRVGRAFHPPQSDPSPYQ